MRMLNEGEEANTEVSWADQQNINKFSLLNGQADKVKEARERVRKEKEQAEDAVQEMELLEDEDTVGYHVGDLFVPITVEETRQKLEKEIATLDASDKKLTSESEVLSAEMDKLKKALYAKFGRAINLERDP